MIDWQATEILAGCLFTALFLALVLIATQCLASCFDNWRSSRLIVISIKCDEKVKLVDSLSNSHSTVVQIIAPQATSDESSKQTARRKHDPEQLPDDYVDEIRRLLDRHKKIMNEYDFSEGTKDGGEGEGEAKKINDSIESVQPITESEIGSPVKIRSRSNSVKLQKLKEELEEYSIHVDVLPKCSMKKCETIRRSWGGLNDSTFDPVELPNSIDAEVQTTATLDRMRMAQKIETTV